MKDYRRRKGKLLSRRETIRSVYLPLDDREKKKK